MLGTKQPDVIEQLAAAQRQKGEIEASLPKLNAAVQAAEAERRDTEARLETIEGDALVGSADKTKVTAARAKHEQAVTAHRTATASLRQEIEKLARLNEAIARLKPQVDAVQIAMFRTRHEELVRQLHEKLEALRPINDALHDNSVAAAQAFPGRRGERLPDFSWPEFRHNPHAVNGGKLGTWLRRVEMFLKGERLDTPQDPPVRVKPVVPKPEQRLSWQQVNERGW